MNRMRPPAWAPTAYRPDIDGLRGLAILLVVVFHAFPQWMRAGFIGVDIFFVISGYLITGILLKEAGQGGFHPIAFYARRALRLFPALALVGAAVLVVGALTLLASEYTQVARYGVASTLFSSNLLSWLDSDNYFSPRAEDKPLLHLWSLGVEEQFYLAWPWMLAMVWRFQPGGRTWGGLWVLSLAATLGWTAWSPHSAFYSPVPRFLELFSGALLAVGQASSWPGLAGRRPAMALAGVALMLLSLGLIHDKLVWPGAWVLLPVTATCCLIASGPDTWLHRRVLQHPACVGLGLISYPLYLWHWPVLSFTHILHPGGLSGVTRMACILVALALAWLTYRLLETPIRTRGRAGQSAGVPARSLLLGCGLAMAGVGLVSGVVWRGQGLPARVPWMLGMDKNLDRIPPQAAAAAHACAAPVPSSLRCWGGEHPTVLVMGDSHGAALAPGLFDALSASGGSWTLAYRAKSVGGCVPLRGVQTYDRHGIARHCREDNDQVYEWALHDPDVKSVVLVGRWATRVGTGVGFGAVEGDDIRATYRFEADQADERDFNRAYQRGLAKTFQDVKAAGKQLVFVHQVPEFGFFPPFCADRPVWVWRWQEAPHQCTLPSQLVDDRQALYRDLTRQVMSAHPGVVEVDPVPAFCAKGLCKMKDEHLGYLYRDDDHINRQGARVVGARIVGPLKAGGSTP